MIKQIQRLFLLLMLVGAQKVSGQILYTDVNPDTIVSCLPLGTLDSAFIDVNQDGQNDFVIKCYSYFISVHQGCCWNNRNEIYGLNAYNGLAYDPTIGSTNCGRIFLDSGYCVGNSYSYQNDAIFSLSGNGSCYIPATIPKYFPIRMLIGGNFCYGWLRILSDGGSIILYDMAINQSPDSCIVTGQTTTIVSELNKETEEIIFPNPVKDFFTLAFGRTIEKGSVEFSNILGDIIFSENLINTSEKEFSVAHIPKGLYFVKVFDGRILLCRKFIVE